MGGEKLLAMKSRATFWGSPPHGRGKVIGFLALLFCLGITPAWAGKRGHLATLAERGKDHPRMGGEKSFFQRLRGMVKGSPPHGRGKAAPEVVKSYLSRITPAWAGKSTSQTSTMKAGRDHPRMGGEK